jgi:hypothetical protein
LAGCASFQALVGALTWNGSTTSLRWDAQALPSSPLLPSAGDLPFDG